MLACRISTLAEEGSSPRFVVEGRGPRSETPAWFVHSSVEQTTSEFGRKFFSTSCSSSESRLIVGAATGVVSKTKAEVNHQQTVRTVRAPTGRESRALWERGLFLFRFAALLDLEGGASAPSRLASTVPGDETDGEDACGEGACGAETSDFSEADFLEDFFEPGRFSELRFSELATSAFPTVEDVGGGAACSEEAPSPTSVAPSSCTVARDSPLSRLPLSGSAVSPLSFFASAEALVPRSSVMASSVAGFPPLLLFFFPLPDEPPPVKKTPPLTSTPPSEEEEAPPLPFAGPFRALRSWRSALANHVVPQQSNCPLQRRTL